MNNNEKINAAFLLIADGFKALAEPLTEELGQRPVAFAPRICPHHWGRLINRCTLPDRHSGEHVFALSEGAIHELIEKR